MPSTALARSELDGEGVELAALMAEAGMTGSRSEARRLIRGGGVYLNGARVTEIGARVRAEDAIEGRFAIVRVGRKRHLAVEVAG